MAVSTFNEKLALITYNQPWNTPIPVPSTYDTLNRGDKQHLLWGYPGINWGSVALGDVLDPTIASTTPARTFTSVTPARIFTSVTPVRIVEAT